MACIAALAVAGAVALALRPDLREQLTGGAPDDRTEPLAGLGALSQMEITDDFIENAVRLANTKAAERALLIYNGFSVADPQIPVSEIRRGGPQRDGIPALFDPAFVPAATVDFLRPTDSVVGMVSGDTAKAYPLRILVWHEVVNDTIAGRPIMVTYCPLCATAMAFSRTYDGETLTFGVSGLLYNSDVLMYDHQTESLWSQLGMKAVTGPMSGRALDWIPSAQMTWGQWRLRYPDSMVLSTDTGHDRYYAGDAYAEFRASSELMFPVPQHRDDLPNKSMVLGIVIDGVAKAYPIESLETASGPVADRVADAPISVQYDREAESATVVRTDTGAELPSVRAYWFAWQAFYPETSLYAAGPGEG